MPHNKYITVAIILLLIAFHNLLQAESIQNPKEPVKEMTCFTSFDDHIWVMMAEKLYNNLYNKELGLFRETFSPIEGYCWYWNTEQGEAYSILSFIDNGSIAQGLYHGYKKYLTIEDNGKIYLFTRYVDCLKIRSLSNKYNNFHVGNYIVYVGGDLSGTRKENDSYKRAIVIGIDTYKNPRDNFESGKAWPEIGRVLILKSHEVQYQTQSGWRTKPESWDVSNTFSKYGKIIDYNITIGQNRSSATRVMSDGNLTYSQTFIIEPGKPYVTVNLTIKNTSNITLTDIRFTLAFDNLDWEYFQRIFIPGLGIFEANKIGIPINEDEKEYHIASTRNKNWETINGKKIILFESLKPIGVNPAFAVIFDSAINLSIWGYGSKHEITNPYGNNITGFFYRWIKLEFNISKLSPGEERSFNLTIIPLRSYAPGYEPVYSTLFTELDKLENRDLTFAFNTGTGPFLGLALLSKHLSTHDREYIYQIFEDTDEIIRKTNWNVSTRIFANYINGLLELYELTNNSTFLDKAIIHVEHLIKLQIRNSNDKRDGGFLDYPPPYGISTPLDVNAEVIRALIKLYSITKDATFYEPVDYWLKHWIHYDSSSKTWYYYVRNNTNSLSTINESQSYSLGYLLNAISNIDAGSPIALKIANILWSRLTCNLTVPPTKNSTGTNVETQAAVSLGLKSLIEKQLSSYKVAIEYLYSGNILSIESCPVQNTNDGLIEISLELEISNNQTPLLVIWIDPNYRIVRVENATYYVERNLSLLYLFAYNDELKIQLENISIAGEENAWKYKYSVLLLIVISISLVYILVGKRRKMSMS